MSTPPPANARLRVLGALLAVLIVVALVAVVLLAGRDRGGAAPGAPGGGIETLRLQGSNTVGAQLAPDLAQAYLLARGAPDVQRTSAGGVETVQGTLPTGPVRIEVRAAGTATGFEGLAAGGAEIGMASRRVSAQQAAEVAAGRGGGDLTARDSEHVLALDALAVVVGPDVGVPALSVEQLRAVHTCAVTDWSQVGGSPGPIRVLARDDDSGTWASVRDDVLAGAPLCATAERFADSGELARAVATGPGAIGVVGLPSAAGGRVLELYDGTSAATAPTALSVSTETYLLTRRLYLYTPAQAGPRARDLVEFALSEPGQRVVAAGGFVSPLFPPPTPPAPACPADLPAYCATVGGGERVPFDVRFDSGTDRVDNRAFRNLDLLVASLAAPGAAERTVLLVGFADNAGTDADNLALSEQRAAAVQSYLAERGVAGALPSGFGEALPVDTNDTAEGREQNRRVEVWLR